MSSEYIIVYIDEYLGSFQFLPIMNSTIMNILTNVFWRTYEHFRQICSDEGELLRTA